MWKYISGFGIATLVALVAFVGLDHDTEAKAKLNGYDLVSYFVNDEPIVGRAEFSFEHDGETYYFANPQNRAKFSANPDRFMPQYDGFCSYGVSLGQKLSIDPNAYRVVNGRLFLQLDPGTREIWMEAEGNNIELADKNWPLLK